MLYLANAFSGQMIPNSCIFSKKPMTLDNVKEMLTSMPWKSCVGHDDTAAVLTDMLGVEVKKERVNVFIKPDDVLIVAQITGGRLPEGATTLPEGFNFEFFYYNLLQWSE